MIFGSKKLLVYLDEKFLQIYSKDLSSPAVLEFGPQTIEFLEVHNLEQLQKEVYNFISKLGLGKQEVYIGLSTNALIEKIIDVDDPSRASEKVENYLKILPFDEKKAIFKIAPIKGGFYIASTNREIYQYIVEIFESLDLSVKAVFPLGFLDNNFSESLNVDQVNDILSAGKLIDKVNLLHVPLAIEKKETKKRSLDSQDPDDNHQQKQTLFNKQFLYLILSMVLFVGAFAVLAANTGYLKLPGRNKVISQREEKSTPLPSTIPAAETNEATAEALVNKKEDVKIQVLNASGIPGEAAKIKERLNASGYTLVEVGNATESAESTAVIYSLNGDLKNDFTNLINILLKDVKVSESTASSEFNAALVIGSN
jgi:hypothetical protein